MKNKRLFSSDYLLPGIAFFLLGIAFVSCTPELSMSKWQATTVKVDGKAKEWSKPLRYYNKDNKLQYTFSNDNKNLYICIRATTENTQTKILRGGIQLWLDTAAKNKARIGLLFPLPDMEDNSQVVPDPKSHPKTDADASHKQISHDLKGMELTGFKPPIGGPTPLINEFGITAEVGMDSLDILTYEAVIPFRTFYRDSLIPSDSSKIISINIVINGVPVMHKTAKDAAKDDPSSSLAGQGMGRQGMSGMGGRGGGHSSAPSNPLFESHTIKTRVKLNGGKK